MREKSRILYLKNKYMNKKRWGGSKERRFSVSQPFSSACGQERKGHVLETGKTVKNSDEPLNMKLQ